MKTLILMRHAEADSEADVASDRKKPLSSGGKEEAQTMGVYFKNHKYVPQQVLCSDATRTRQTLEVLLPSLGEPDVLYKPKLYLASVGELFQQIHAVDDELDTLLVLAHNPGVQHAAAMLAGYGSADRLRRLHLMFPTASAAILTIGRDRWIDFEPGLATLKAFVQPK